MMLLAFICHKDFIFFQMDVNSAFLNGYIMEEVYVKQPLVLKMKNLQIMFISCQKHCMD